MANQTKAPSAGAALAKQIFHGEALQVNILKKALENASKLKEVMNGSKDK